MRELLPARRQSERFEFNSDGVSYLGSIGRFDDGRVAEVFIDGRKVGTAASIAAKDAAVAASLALQFGCPIETLRGALLRLGDGSAAGPLGRALDLAEEGSQ